MTSILAHNAPQLSRKDQEALNKYLPVELRSDHWFNDLHHTMLLILFSDLKRSVARGRSGQQEYYVDTITVYWVIHCLMEEEGFSHALLNGVVTRELIAEHAKAHKELLLWWSDNVVTPFKAGALLGASLSAASEQFLQHVLAHIKAMDMTTYGEDSQRAQSQIISEVAHIAKTGLPLSPYMQGAVSLIRSLLPNVAASLSPASLTPRSMEPVGSLRLSRYRNALCNEARSGFRDLLISRTVLAS